MLCVSPPLLEALGMLRHFCEDLPACTCPGDIQHDGLFYNLQATVQDLIVPEADAGVDGRVIWTEEVISQNHLISELPETNADPWARSAPGYREPQVGWLAGMSEAAEKCSGGMHSVRSARTCLRF